MDLHPIVQDAARGTLPEWACASEKRRAHMGRVADLLQEWAEADRQAPEQVSRWRSLGFLHDALRDGEPSRLRDRLPPSLHELPDPILHGPAAAERLRVDGVLDGELLLCVAHHTLGDAGFGDMGRTLYAADFLDPDRPFLQEWRAELRARMPRDRDRVVFEIVGARIKNLIERGRTVHPRTLAFWNALASEQS